jgi:hypothetical protein
MRKLRRVVTIGAPIGDSPPGGSAAADWALATVLGGKFYHHRIVRSSDHW